MIKPYGKYEDSELFAALKEKKAIAEAAFAELYSRHSQRIYAYCLRVTGSPEDARDIFQDTFTKFYRSANHKDIEVDNVPAYLLTIARNHCINYKRNRKIIFNFDDYNFSTNDTGYEQKELLELVGRALDTLDFEYRETFVLRQYHGLSYKEISKITGDSIAAIKNRVWRAKEKIKQVLEPYLEDLSNI